MLLSTVDDPQPSTRIAVLRMLPYLRESGFDPHIVFEPEVGTETPDLSGLAPRWIAEGCRIVYFQKVYGPTVEEAAGRLREAGVKTVYGVCDLVKPAMTEATDVTITVTDYLKSLYPPALREKVRVVHDGIEHPEIRKEDWGGERGTRRRPLRAVLVTSSHLDRLPVLGEPPPGVEVAIVGRYPPAGRVIRRLREARWTLASLPNRAARKSYLKFLMNPRVHRRAWDPVGVYDALLEADVGIIPIDPDPGPEGKRPDAMWKVRSENRLTMKMCVGLPVVATPVPAYEAVIEEGATGFIARDRGEWLRALDILRDPEVRKTVGEKARASVVTRFSTDEQARRMIDVLRGLVTERVA